MFYYIRNGYNDRWLLFLAKGTIAREYVGKTKRDPRQQIPLTPAVFHILLALADGEKHGYAIMKEVQDATGGQVTMGPGTLYGSLKRMLKADMIRESSERADPDLDDSRRRYYELTAHGRRVMEAEAQRLAQAVRWARQKKALGPATINLQAAT